MESPSKTISEGIILLVLSAVSYAGAYLYEFGFAGHFGIPKEYVYVDTRGLVVFFVVFLSVLIVTYQFLTFIQIAREGDSERPLHKLLKKQCVWFGIPIFIVFIAAAPPREWFNLFLIPVILLVGDILGPFFLRNVKGGFQLAFEDWMKDGGSTIPTPIDNKLSSISGKGLVNLVYLIIMLLFIANAMGAGEARRKTDFLFSSDESRIVLRRYGTDWVFAEYDHGANKIAPNFIVIDFAKEKLELKLIRRNVFGKIEPQVSLTKVSAQDHAEGPPLSATNSVRKAQ
ncbi:MAG: hypothetical protein K0Q55_1308 [Verrucomicrobia bacterium]|jgi:hypothetical protein|nr:hypothetical protein [Verrucomicrobiota bacterium]